MKIHLSEVQAEKMADRNIQNILRSDQAFQNAKSFEDQFIREAEIEYEVWARIESEYIID